MQGMANSNPLSPFNSYAALQTSPAGSPRIGVGGYRSPSRFGHPPPGSQGSETEAAHRMKSLRLTPRQGNKSLASMLLETDQRHEAAQQAQRRRDLVATKSGLEVRGRALHEP